MNEPLSALSIRNDRRIVLLVLDGLGGLPGPDGKTELEAATTPNLDRLAREGECGTHLPVGYGIAPGSAPGHLSLFGYNPLDYPIGRGIVAALGIGFPIAAGDVAVRLNFASRDAQGNVTDRRAGRIATELCAQLCTRLDRIEVPGATLSVRPVMDYRAVVVFSGAGLSDKVADTDPQAVGVPAREPQALDPRAEDTVLSVKALIAKARELLAQEPRANEVLLRGFAQLPEIPSLQERFMLNAVALAVYPDYKGVSRLVGMDVVEDLADLRAQGQALQSEWQERTFFFLHHKYTDSRAEDGDFAAKVSEIEKVDRFLPAILDLKPDVLVVTGDHCTPSQLRAHSSHPVPFLIYGAEARPDRSTGFGEREAGVATWPAIPGTALIALAMGYAGKVAKYGA